MLSLQRMLSTSSRSFLLGPLLGECTTNRIVRVAVRNLAVRTLPPCYGSFARLESATLISRSTKGGINPLTGEMKRGFASNIAVDEIDSHTTTSDAGSAKTDTTLLQNNPKPNFDCTQVAYESRTTVELWRAFLSFRLCQIRFLVKHSEDLLVYSRRILGDTIIDGILKATLYGHFCAGEDQKRIMPVVKTMEKAGIGSILDYVAEGGNDGKAIRLEDLAKMVALSLEDRNARVYDYVDEASCDRHAETFKRCIRDVADLQADGYAAVKVSGLVDPKLLARTSRAIVETRNLFNKFDTNHDGFISRDEFEQGFKLFFKNDERRMNEMLDSLQMGGHRDKMIDYVSWSMLLGPRDLPQITAGCRTTGPLAGAAATAEELEMLERMYVRMHNLAEEAASCGTRLLVDAEQALFQPAIDNLVLELQREYNDPTKTDHPVIYNTYQCYLRDSGDRLSTDLDRSKRLRFHFGAKLVRGAYMESERELARTMGYDSPVYETIEDTHKSYDDNVRFMLEQSKLPEHNNVELMLASHNQESVQKAIDVMNELGIDRRDPTICFAQLYGMMDNVTYSLGKLGYRVFKYVPYGEVKLAMPYLVRRARENSSISVGAARQLDMIKQELKRRLLSP